MSLCGRDCCAITTFNSQPLKGCGALHRGRFILHLLLWVWSTWKALRANLPLVQSVRCLISLPLEYQQGGLGGTQDLFPLPLSHRHRRIREKFHAHKHTHSVSQTHPDKHSICVEHAVCLQLCPRGTRESVWLAFASGTGLFFFLKGEEGKLRQTGGKRELDREEMHKKRKKKYFPLITSLSELRFICHKRALRHTASHQSDSNQKLAFSSCLFTHSAAHQTQWIYDRTVWTALPMFFHQLGKIKALIMQRDSHRLSVYIFVEHNYGWAIYRSIFWEYLHLRFSCTVLTKVS